MCDFGISAWVRWVLILLLVNSTAKLRQLGWIAGAPAPATLALFVPLNDWNDYDSDGAYTFPSLHPRSCSPASFPLNGLIFIDPTAFHIDTMLLGELLHTYLVLVSSLPFLLLMLLPLRTRFICLPLRANFH
ncbi:hypothetical protein B0H14DRAFT_3447408 [Mycena olivaceomarginata]|nr:hypothetical protein B0H14DRAFT_3447408 [Mycena olivaceomarginata]